MSNNEPTDGGVTDAIEAIVHRAMDETFAKASAGVGRFSMEEVARNAVRLAMDKARSPADNVITALTDALYDADTTSRLAEHPEDVPAYREKALAVSQWLGIRGFALTPSIDVPAKHDPAAQPIEELVNYYPTVDEGLVERVARIIAPESWRTYDRFIDPAAQPKMQLFTMIYRQGLTKPEQWRKWWAEDAAPPYVDYHIGEWRQSVLKARAALASIQAVKPNA